MNIVLFEDHLVAQLAPATLLRPAYTLSCGGTSLREIAEELSESVHGAIREYLEPTQCDHLDSKLFAPGEPSLFLNARLVPDAATLREVVQRVSQQRASCHVQVGDSMALCFVANASNLELEGQSVAQQSVLEFVRGQTNQGSQQIENDSLSLFQYPHELITRHQRILAGNLADEIDQRNYVEIQPGVFVVEAMKSPPNVVFDTSGGPIILESGVSIGAFTVIKGPTRIGANTKISPHSYLKGTLSIGHTCKVGGELSKSVVEAYSNKVHAGFLGCAYLGRWVNLGAGTSNSNLKNTYGSIRVEYHDVGRVDTGEQFLGCVIGDYSKTAINCSIYTGKIIGVCSNMYGTVTANVPSFCNYAKSFGEITEHPPEVMSVTQQRVFKRRGILARECDQQLLHDAYAIERPKRQLANTSPSF